MIILPNTRRPKSAPKSNTWVVVIPFVLCFLAVGGYFEFAKDKTYREYDVLALVGLFSIPFLATAVAQLRSDYFWRNLAPGNRGEHRSDHPKMFLVSTFGYFAAGISIVAWFVHLFFIQEQKRVVPNPPPVPALDSKSSAHGPP